MDTDWAVVQLDSFIADVGPGGIANDTDDDRTVLEALPIVERILTRALPGWRTSVAGPQLGMGPWAVHREAALRARALLHREEELREKLGDDAPQIDASLLHPWVWNGAMSLWESGHYAEAVLSAGKKVNAETQNKVGRRDVSEAKLFREAFSLDPPKPGVNRLRLGEDDGGPSFQNRNRGAMDYAAGWYTAIRGPDSHEPTEELPEHVALERLAALSVLARWVDAAETAEVP